MIHILNILFYISYIFNDQKRNNSCLFSKRIIGWSIMQSKSTIKLNRLVRNIRDTHAEQPFTKLSCSEQYITVYIVKQYIYFFHLLFVKEEFLCSFYRWGFWHSKRKSNLLKVTWVEEWMQTQGSLIPKGFSGPALPSRPTWYGPGPFACSPGCQAEHFQVTRFLLVFLESTFQILNISCDRYWGTPSQTTDI